MAQNFTSRLSQFTDRVSTTACRLVPFNDLWAEATKKPSWSLRKEWDESPSFTPHFIGQVGEDLAALHLKKKGYKILYRNFSPPQGGEIDIIARHQNTLVFIEVKTRSGTPKKRPLLAITKAKRQQLKKGALQYLRLLHIDAPYRYDAVEVLLPPGSLPVINVIECLEVSE